MTRVASMASCESLYIICLNLEKVCPEIPRKIHPAPPKSIFILKYSRALDLWSNAFPSISQTYSIIIMSDISKVSMCNNRSPKLTLHHMTTFTSHWFGYSIPSICQHHPSSIHKDHTYTAFISKLCSFHHSRYWQVNPNLTNWWGTSSSNAFARSDWP